MAGSNRFWRLCSNASNIIVPLLGFGGYEAARFAAPKRAAIQIRLQLRGFMLALPARDFLHVVKQALGNVAARANHAVQRHRGVGFEMYHDIIQFAAAPTACKRFLNNSESGFNCTAR